MSICSIDTNSVTPDYRECFSSKYSISQLGSHSIIDLVHYVYVGIYLPDQNIAI